MSLKSVFVCICVFAAQWSVAQGDSTSTEKSIKIKFDAKITSIEELGAKLDVASVLLLRDNVPMDSTITQRARAYFELDTGYIYRIVFKKNGYMNKNLVIDTHEIPGDFKKKSKLKVEIGLFKKKADFHVEFLDKEPIGIASYNFISKKIMWDAEYTRLMVEKIIESTLEYAKNKDERKKSLNERRKKL